VGGCDDGTTSDKDPKGVAAAKAKPADPKKDPPKDGTNPPPNDPPKDPPTKTIIHDGDRYPEVMGGAAVPVPFEPPPAEIGALGAATAEAEAAAAPAAAAPDPAAADAVAAAKAGARVAVALVHNHPTGDPCKPLTDAEVGKALADLKATRP